jgi:hypothetical protein
MKPTQQLHVLRQSLWLDDNNSGGIAIARPPLLRQFRSSGESAICRTASGRIAGCE